MTAARNAGFTRVHRGLSCPRHVSDADTQSMQRGLACCDYTSDSVQPPARSTDVGRLRGWLTDWLTGAAALLFLIAVILSRDRFVAAWFADRRSRGGRRRRESQDVTRWQRQRERETERQTDREKCGDGGCKVRAQCDCWSSELARCTAGLELPRGFAVIVATLPVHLWYCARGRLAGTTAVFFVLCLWRIARNAFQETLSGASRMQEYVSATGASPGPH